MEADIDLDTVGMVGTAGTEGTGGTLDNTAELCSLRCFAS